MCYTIVNHLLYVYFGEKHCTMFNANKLFVYIVYRPVWDLAEEGITCIFDDNYGIILLIHKNQLMDNFTYKN